MSKMGKSSFFTKIQGCGLVKKWQNLFKEEQKGENVAKDWLMEESI